MGVWLRIEPRARYLQPLAERCDKNEISNTDIYML